MINVSRLGQTAEKALNLNDERHYIIMTLKTSVKPKTAQLGSSYGLEQCQLVCALL